jgi:hypothetical protein
MPIKPENRSRYPKNWSEIRAQIMARAGNRCEHEGCGAEHRAVGVWKAGVFFKMWASKAEADDCAIEALRLDGERVTEIVLTIAHLDHTPEHNDPSNLKAMCQRHHLAYDQQHHLINAYMTRKRRAQTMEMPL